MDYFSDEGDTAREGTPNRLRASNRLSSGRSSSTMRPAPAGEMTSGNGGLTFIPKGLNWLNVPDSVQDSVCALDLALVNSRRENKRLEKHVQKLEERLGEVMETVDRLYELLQSEQQKTLLIRREMASLSSQLAQQQQSSSTISQPPVKSSEIDKEQIVNRAVEELKQMFRPDEVRATLKKVETATRLPNQILKRVEVLEQFRLNMLAKASTQEQVRKVQKMRLEEATSSLRKLSV